MGIFFSVKLPEHVTILDGQTQDTNIDSQPNTDQPVFNSFFVSQTVLACNWVHLPNTQTDTTFWASDAYSPCNSSPLVGQLTLN